jgi:predicted RNase H-like nuclease
VSIDRSAVAPSKTLGVDLASSDENTALAVIVWRDGRAWLETLEQAFAKRGARDEASPVDRRILELAEGADAIGIDAPFGWPSAFRALLAGATPEPWSDARRDALRFRVTDFAVRALAGFWPLSVSTDLVALPALRCHGLLRALGVVDRSGDGRVFEVYPRLGLVRWELDARGTSYKGADGARRRAALVDALKARCRWLDLREHDAALRESDDALDAVLAALLARAAAVRLVEPIPEADREAARTEGWIVVPAAGSLARLADP